MNNDIATPKQKDFILSLVADRAVPAEFRTTIDEEWTDLTKAVASEFINALKLLPYAQKVSHLDGLTHSYYAIPAFMVNPALTDIEINNDMMFVVVAQYMNTVYMKQVHGSVENFARSRMSARDVRAVAKVLKTDPLRFIQLFGESHGVCGKCAAKLTDQKSRETGFGPDCRKQLGL